MTGRFIERRIEMCSSWAAIGLGKFVKQQRCRSEEEWGGNKSEARGIVLKAIEKALDFMLSGLESPRRIVSRGGTWSNHTHTLTHAHTHKIFNIPVFNPQRFVDNLCSPWATTLDAHCCHVCPPIYWGFPPTDKVELKGGSREGSSQQFMHIYSIFSHMISTGPP